MRITLPLLLATRFSDLTPKDVVTYALLGSFLILFAVYYRKRAQGTSLSVVQHRHDYVKAHPDLDKEIYRAIEKGELLKGMSGAEVTAAIGSPRRVQVLRTHPVQNEIWIYQNGIYAAMEEGVLQKWDIRKKLIHLR